jgi:hypothetical protein
MSADWPLQSHLELGALPTAPGCARLHAKQVLWQWGLGALSETVELLVSEIVTNGVRASQELVAGRFGGQRLAEIPTVRLWLSSDRAAVLIQVWDADHRMPERQDGGPRSRKRARPVTRGSPQRRMGVVRPEPMAGQGGLGQR